MLYKASKLLTLVIYEDQKATKCFEIRRSHIKFILIILPLITFISLGLGIYSLLTVKKRILELEKERPAQIQLLSDQLAEATKEKVDAVNNYDILLKKLNTPASEGALILPLVTPVSGFTDLRNKKLLELNNFRLEKEGNSISCSFDIMNKVEPEKTSGYVFVVLQTGSTMHVHPKQDLPFKAGLTQFDAGDRFTVTRFRPFTADFEVTKSDETFSVKIYVFSRHGDLLLLEEEGPITRK